MEYACRAGAVAAVKTDPDVAVRLGRRAIRPLTAKLGDPDKGVRGAAANALTQLGDERAITSLVKALKK
jgi:HEAT repeat protein